MTRVPQKRWNGTWRNRLAGNGDKGLESGTESVIEVSAVGAARRYRSRNDGARRRVRATTVPTRPKRDDMPTAENGPHAWVPTIPAATLSAAAGWRPGYRMF